IQLFLNRRLFRRFREARGTAFMIASALYYTTLYPLAAGAGALGGVVTFFRGHRGHTGRATMATKSESSQLTSVP
ncbi:MAG: hypothetical protein R3231_01880, partial [bacterium]|nr:hypothetical protein [bacterium]